jgi:hypothetical protein
MNERRFTFRRRQFGVGRACHRWAVALPPAGRGARALGRLVRSLRWLASVSALLVLGARAGAAANDFGFSGREIYPIESQISLLHAADLDGDGLTDLIVANNVRSRISLLYNQTGKTNRAAIPPPRERELNELPPDARFRLESIASEKRIAAMVVTDLNGDGRPDIAYYGDPKELILLYNQGTNTWSAPRRWPIEDGQLTQNALAAGDVNGDGRTDLLLLAENFVYLLAQKEDHTLAEPEKIPFASPVRSVQVVDVDGDGRDDLLLVNWESSTPFRFRLQNAAGRLGPELYFSLPPIRSYLADNLEKNHQTFIVTIAYNSGRAQISEFVRKPAEPLAGAFRQGQFQVLPLNKTDKARRGLLWADVNGDGREDLLVAEPESGQLSVYLQNPGGALADARTFPCLAGVSDLAVADWDGDGKPEIFLLSPDERQVGVTRFDERQRLPFPTLIPFDGKPLVFAVGALRPGAKPTLAVLLEKDDRRLLATRTADGQGRTRKLSEHFKSNPTRLAMHDVNQDGLMDLVALVPYEKVKILLQVGDDHFDELDVAPPGGVIESPWLSAADVDGDGKAELLLPQKNFLRAVVLARETAPAAATNQTMWTFLVKDQINGAASNSRLAGAAAVRNGTNAVASLFLLDTERKALSLCERDAAGVWQVLRNVSLPVSEFGGLQAVALGGPRLNTVALLGLNAVAWLPLAGERWELSELDGYETPIKDGYLNDVVAGDLNNDGRKDLVFLETARNYLDLVIFNAQHKLVPADRWQVFEQRTFRGRMSDQSEPREAVVADFTGDGKNDLAVIVHDRIIVYPQE